MELREISLVICQALQNYYTKLEAILKADEVESMTKSGEVADTI